MDDTKKRYEALERQRLATIEKNRLRGAAPTLSEVMPNVKGKITNMSNTVRTAGSDAVSDAGLSSFLKSKQHASSQADDFLAAKVKAEKLANAADDLGGVKKISHIADDVGEVNKFAGSANKFGLNKILGILPTALTAYDVGQRAYQGDLAGAGKEALKFGANQLIDKGAYALGPIGVGLQEALTPSIAMAGDSVEGKSAAELSNMSDEAYAEHRPKRRLTAQQLNDLMEMMKSQPRSPEDQALVDLRSKAIERGEDAHQGQLAEEAMRSQVAAEDPTQRMQQQVRDVLKERRRAKLFSEVKDSMRYSGKVE